MRSEQTPTPGARRASAVVSSTWADRRVWELVSSLQFQPPIPLLFFSSKEERTLISQLVEGW